MKTIFVVLPFGTENYAEIACNIAHDAELRFDTYLQVISPLTPARNLLMREDTSPINFLFYSLSYMLEADVVVFPYDWQGDRECSLLHAIALAYGLNILDMKEPVGKLLKGSGNINSCPFCKSSDLILRKLSNGEGYAMHCNNCGATGSIMDTAQKAVDAWNKGDAKHV